MSRQANHIPDPPAERYVDPYLAGVLLGVLLFVANYVTGHGLGASGGMSRLTAIAVDSIAPSHVDHNGFFAGLARPWRSALNHWILWTLVGAVFGAAVSGALAGRFRPQIYRGPRVSIPVRLAAALAGGALMGYGAEWGRGCTSGQALSGGAVLSVGSWLFMFAVFAGGYSLAYFVRRLWR